MKKGLLVFMLLVGFAGAVFAQGGRISYQAVVRNSQHQLLYDTNMTVVVGVYSPSETLVYSERHEVRSDANGLIALMIGEGTPLSGSWTAIDWSDCTVKTEMQIDGATMPVTFTATLGNVNPAGYTYAWTVGGVAQAETGSTFTLAYGSAQEVKCRGSVTVR